MPYPAQIDRESLVETAWQMIEAEGSAQNVTLARLAAAFGVKAPSLYRHVTNKTELLRAVNLITYARHTAFMWEAIADETGTSFERALVLSRAYRAFALAHPVTYPLAYATPLDLQPEPQALEAMAQPLQAVMADLCGPDHALQALRGVWALVHGFVMLELNQLFRREGDVEAAFEAAVQAYLRGWPATMT